MKFRHKYPLVVLHIFWLTLCFGCLSSYAVEQVARQDIASDQIDSTLARLSDEQVRTLLLDELSQKSASNKQSPQKESGFLQKAAGLLHILDDAPARGDINEPQTSFSSFVSDLIAVARKIGNGSIGGFFVGTILLAGTFLTAFVVEFISRRFTAEFSRQFQEKAIPELDGPMRFLAGVMRSIPLLIHILVFSLTAILLFLLLPFSEHPAMRYLFFGDTLFNHFLSGFESDIADSLCSQNAIITNTSHDRHSSDIVTQGILLLCTYTFSSIMFLAFLMEMQLRKSHFIITTNVLAFILISMIVIAVLRSRDSISKIILERSEKNKTRNWVVEQFARFWHVPTILYFIMILAILIHSQSSDVKHESPAFLLSLCAPTLFLLFDSVGQWVVRASMSSLRIYNSDAEEDADEEMMLQLTEAKERERKFTITAGRFVRLLILASLLIWAGSLWGYHIPYASNISEAVFESLTALALGLIAWRFTSSYIERKIAESTPKEEVEEKDNDNEFGGTAQRSRSFTLFPLLRKIIASTILVMVTLVILSSLGVDIGPLLAGAGVVGLAVGFGAQKLVSDIFSGFFYLLDDAFRVGEYIQAGSVSGAVESITLRNVMLRHHRGMLQIVPHSELGSITNFMRGGIIVKFNLEFPYDADVDKIRRVIKKVGKAMLNDEEFGKDFINPVKSAGVREITGSVMTIRVKFKSQPGTHFVIRREAYRRITEALNTQGIFYAHRKVIVELPEGMQNASPEEKQKVLEAGAAAELTQIEDEQKKAAAEAERNKLSTD